MKTNLTLLALCALLPVCAYAHGELDLRIAAATKAIEAASKPSAQLYLTRGELHREHQDWEAAEADYARAAQLDPNLVAVDLGRARMFDSLGHLEAARGLFNKVLERSPAEAEAFIGRARVLVKLRQPQAAIADFKRGLELLSAPPPDCFVELSKASIAAGQTNQALENLDWGISKLGPLLLLQAAAVDLELQRKNHQAALARIETILGTAPRKENWLARKGGVLLAAGRAAEARQAYQDALAAIKALPRPVQEGPAMLKLQAEVTSALAGMTNASPARK